MTAAFCAVLEAPVSPDLTPERPVGDEPNRPHVVCVRCGMSRPRTGDVTAPGHCHVCAPDPATRAYLSGEVRQRVRKAVRAAQNTIEAPDTEHIWQHRPSWPAAHLFAMNATTSLCDGATIDFPARPWDDSAARKGPRVCWACVAAHRAGVERGL